jgi:hypothetical protein
MANARRVIVVAKIVLDVIVQVRRTDAPRRHIHWDIVPLEIVVEIVLDVEVSRAGCIGSCRITSSCFTSSCFTAAEVVGRIAFVGSETVRLSFAGCWPIVANAGAAPTTTTATRATLRVACRAGGIATFRCRIERARGVAADTWFAIAGDTGSAITNAIASAAATSAGAALAASPTAFTTRIDIAGVDVARINISRVDFAHVSVARRKAARFVGLRFEAAGVNIARVDIAGVDATRQRARWFGAAGLVGAFLDDATSTSPSASASAAASIPFIVVTGIGITGITGIACIADCFVSFIAFVACITCDRRGEAAEIVVGRGICCRSGTVFTCRFIAARRFVPRKLIQKGAGRRLYFVGRIGSQPKRCGQMGPIGRSFGNRLRLVSGSGRRHLNDGTRRRDHRGCRLDSGLTAGGSIACCLLGFRRRFRTDLGSQAKPMFSFRAWGRHAFSMPQRAECGEGR